MKLEIVIPDETPLPTLKRLQKLVTLLSSQPELVDDFQLGEDDDLELTSAQLKAVIRARQEIHEGRGLTPQQVREELEIYRSSWLKSQSHTA